MPIPLVLGHQYSELVSLFDVNLATVRAVTASYQQTLRDARQNPTRLHNTYQRGDLALWNPRSFISNHKTCSETSWSLHGSTSDKK